MTKKYSTIVNKTKSISLNFSGEEKTENSQIWQKFLQFQLGSKDIGLLPAEMVWEVICLQEQEVLPVPQMPLWTIGVYSWRSEMLWLVDLETLLADYSYLLRTKTEDDQQSLITAVIKFEEQFLGLILPKVYDIGQYDMTRLNPPSEELFSNAVLRLITGYFADQNNQVAIVLAAKAIFNHVIR